MRDELIPVLLAEELEEGAGLTLRQLCQACDMPAEWVMELVAEGVLEPVGRGPAVWRFPASSLRRARIVRHLQRDLDVNLAGAALALEMLDEIERLRELLRRYRCEF